MLEYIRDTVKPDVLVWTGDNSNHALWSVSEEDIIDSSVTLTQMIAEVFGQTEVTVLPIHGNHDFYPPNLQDMSLGVGTSIYIDLYS